MEVPARLMRLRLAAGALVEDAEALAA